MAKKTTENIGLELPETTDFYDVEVVNNNNRLIDRFFANLKKKIVDVTEFDYFYSMIGNRLKKNYKNNSKFFLGILFDINNKTNK